jgi:hypothetical protein
MPYVLAMDVGMVRRQIRLGIWLSDMAWRSRRQVQRYF